MARTTETAVKTVLNSTISDATVTPFISDANILVTQVLGDSDLSDDMLTAIEKWLAAHMLAMTPHERQAFEKEVGKAKEKYGKGGLRLEATTYGQMVLMLDTTGNFSRIDDKVQPSSLLTITEYS